MPRTALLVLLLAAAPAAGAAEVTIGIIIDDLGNSLVNGRRAVDLPGAVTCAVLPHTAHARVLADAARARGKEVLLHLPMEAREPVEPGPGQIDARMPRLEVRATLDYDLSTVPHVIGINNHMGSLMTTQAAAMDELMLELRRRNLFFVDSRTHAATVAAARARLHGVPVLERDVFLDRDSDPAAIAAQLQRLEQLARRKGYALAIGHPLTATLDALERWLPTLAERGIRLVPLTVRLAQIRPAATENPPAATRVHPRNSQAQPWHASSSR